MAIFAISELHELVNELHTTKPSVRVSDGDLLGALVLAARRSPIEAVKAVISTYLDRESDEAARASTSR
jgi:hypothetical protein